MRYYVHNLETDKLNIFTDGKQDWLTIPEPDREKLKNACLWSRSINGWVSRCKGGVGRFYAEDVLKRNGFEYRGNEGEKLSFLDQVQAKQDRAENRANRFDDRATASESKAQSLYKHAHTMADCIPFGQPILIGHYSEGRDRRFREKIHRTFGRAFEENDKAKYYASRAETARLTASGAEYSNPRYLGNRIKECKAVIAVLENRLQGKVYSYSEPRPISDESRERYEGALDEQHEKLEFFEHCLATCGRTIFDKVSLAGKTEVKLRGRWEPIVRLNPTTVAVPGVGCTPEICLKWPMKYPYTEVQDAR